jgi:hypothetical protein
MDLIPGCTRAAIRLAREQTSLTMTTRPSYLGTTPDYPPREDLFSWLPAPPPTFAPSHFSNPEQSLHVVRESPKFPLVSVATREECTLTPDSVLSATPRPQDRIRPKCE